jgi:hypothetical protein
VIPSKAPLLVMQNSVESHLEGKLGINVMWLYIGFERRVTHKRFLVSAYLLEEIFLVVLAIW